MILFLLNLSYKLLFIFYQLWLKKTIFVGLIRGEIVTLELPTCIVTFSIYLMVFVWCFTVKANGKCALPFT